MSARRLAVLILAALAAAACREKPEVSVYRAPKEEAPQLPAMAGLPPPAQGEIQWKIPAAWKPLAGSAMRYATFKTGEAELSVVVLPGDAGGALANVNRWRGQINLGPLDQKALDSFATRVQSPAGTSLSVDFKTDDGRKRLLGAILSAGDKTWFFKMTGDPSSVGAAKNDFHDFLKSLRLASS